MRRRIAVLALLSLHASLQSGTAASAARLGERCGGMAGPRCDEGLWCEKPPGTCYLSDLPGTCAKASEICAQIYDPVCGCDGRTYGNDCERRFRSIQLRHRGRC
jgi:hypothetical protein